MHLLTPSIYAIFGGLVPALFWLWFWLREDKLHPEPLKRILWSFGFGALVVILVLPIQKFILDVFAATTTTLVLWALTEEVAKLGAAMLVVYHRRVFDEPIDALVYLISAALGFAAAENAFFLFSAITDGTVHIAVITGNVRFVGASLLHVISSASIGAGIAFGWYKRKAIKELDFLAGLSVAVVLHTLFNLFILKIKGAGIFLVFLSVWISVAVLLALFEAIKRIHAPKNLHHTFKNYKS
jgi:RsiW-degrading membrane proteinase PrsW (M82 family)